MKKCPQCNSVFENETIYCLNDGAQLREESFSLPSSSAADSSDDEPTLLRSKPIVIDLSAPNEPSSPVINPPLPSSPYENIIVVPAETASANRNYALVLVIGLLIGGGLVLATLLLSKNFNQDANTGAVETNVNFPVAKTEKSKSSPEIQDKGDALLDDITPSKHAEPNDDAAESSNGRVIARNARVRLAPDKDAPVVDTIPMNDRLDIIRRENTNSPWYQIECEHGTGGWMHGDTIEFIR